MSVDVHVVIGKGKDLSEQVKFYCTNFKAELEVRPVDDDEISLKKPKFFRPDEKFELTRKFTLWYHFKNAKNRWTRWYHFPNEKIEVET